MAKGYFIISHLKKVNELTLEKMLRILAIKEEGLFSVGRCQISKEVKNMVISGWLEEEVEDMIKKAESRIIKHLTYDFLLGSH